MEQNYLAPNLDLEILIMCKHLIYIVIWIILIHTCIIGGLRCNNE